MVRLTASVIGIGVEPADMRVQEVLSCNLRDRQRLPATRGSLACMARAVPNGGRKAWRRPVTPECAVG